MKITIEINKEEIKSEDELISFIDFIKESTSFMDRHIKMQKRMAEYDRRSLNMQRNMRLIPAFVYCFGICIKGKEYRSDALIDLLGRRVLITMPENGKIKVYSTEGQYLTEAFIVENQENHNLL